MATFGTVPTLPQGEDRSWRAELAYGVLRLGDASARQADDWLRELGAPPLRRYAGVASEPPSSEDCAIAWELVWRLSPWLLPRVFNPFAVSSAPGVERSGAPSFERARFLEHIARMRELFDLTGLRLQPSALLERTRDGDDHAIVCALLWGDAHVSSLVLGQQAVRLRRVSLSEVDRAIDDRGPYPIEPIAQRHHTRTLLFAFSRLRTVDEALRFAGSVGPALKPLPWRTLLRVALLTLAIVPSWSVRHRLAATLAAQSAA